MFSYTFMNKKYIIEELFIREMNVVSFNIHLDNSDGVYF